LRFGSSPILETGAIDDQRRAAIDGEHQGENAIFSGRSENLEAALSLALGVSLPQSKSATRRSENGRMRRRQTLKQRRGTGTSFLSPRILAKTQTFHHPDT